MISYLQIYFLIQPPSQKQNLWTSLTKTKLVKLSWSPFYRWETEGQMNLSKVTHMGSHKPGIRTRFFWVFLSVLWASLFGSIHCIHFIYTVLKVYLFVLHTLQLPREKHYREKSCTSSEYKSRSKTDTTFVHLCFHLKVYGWRKKRKKEEMKERAVYTRELFWILRDAFIQV